MSLISIAQRETLHISFVQFINNGYGADLLTPDSIKKSIAYFGREAKGLYVILYKIDEKEAEKMHMVKNLTN